MVTRPAPEVDDRLAAVTGGEPLVPPGRHGRGPTWLVHLAGLGWRALVVLALAAVVFYAATLLLTVTASTIAGGIVAATVAPVVASLRRRRWSRSRSAAVGWLLAWGAIAAVGLAVLIAFAPYAAELLRAIASAVAWLQDQSAANALPPALVEALGQVGGGVTDWLAVGVRDLVADVATIASVTLFSFFLSFFLLLDADRGWAWAMQFVAEGRRSELGGAAEVAVDRVGGFVRDATALSVVRSAIVLVGLLATGVPFAGPLTALVFVGGYVPYLGGMVTTAAVVLVASSSQGLAVGALLLVLIAVVDVILGRLRWRAVHLRPTRLHPAVVLVLQLLGLTIAGIAGAFAAVPIAAAVAAMAGPLAAGLAFAEGDGRPADGYVPVWLDRLAWYSWRLLVGIALVAVLVILAVRVPMLLSAVLVGLILAATVSPFVRALRRRGLSPTAAAVWVTGATVVATLAIVLLTVGSLVHHAGDIASASGGGASGIDGSAGGRLDALPALVERFGATIVASAALIAASLTAAAIVLILAVLLTFFLLRDGAAGWTFSIRRLAVWRRVELDAAVGRAAGVLGGYMLGTAAISAFGAATQWLIMTILGIPLALPLGVLAFFAGFIPYFGSFIATGLAFLVTVHFGTTQDVAVMAIFTVVFNIVQGNVVAPLVYGRAVSLHPAVVLMAIPAGSALAGVAGMFLIVPFLGIVATTWRAVLGVLGDPPAATPRPEVPAPDAPSRSVSAAAADPAVGSTA